VSTSVAAGTPAAASRAAREATGFLEQEARALLTRLDSVRPFVLNETMVPAAAPTPRTLSAIEQFLLDGRRELRKRVTAFVDWLHGPGGHASAAEQQSRFTQIRMGFNDVLSQFDLFTEAVTQRSEHRTGVWLSGLDMLATDALALPSVPAFESPPLMCYLARGPGAAIRRARTRLPGGRDNPVAMIRVPRERMVGHGIASSLVHEVGHQASALLELVESLRPALLAAAERKGTDAAVSRCWAQWISEIVADLWSVAKLGVGSTLGLIGVVSLPRWFVFRPSGADPHPIPWIRVQVSAAIGDALYPDPQWQRVAGLWSALYPLDRAPAAVQPLLRLLLAQIPAFVDALLAHRPPAFTGRSVGDVLRMPDRRRAALLARFEHWRDDPGQLFAVNPTLAFAVIGQARGDGLLSPERESRLLGEQLTQWAVRSSLDTALLCAHPGARVGPITGLTT
jgi:hypothetical protein